MINLQNQYLKVLITEEGAELKSIFDMILQKEIIWQNKTKTWNKSSPVLFPIIGMLRNGQYQHNGKLFKLSKHGFARDCIFTLKFSNKECALLSLSSELNKAVYPFDYELLLKYELIGRSLKCTYTLINKSPENIYFSLGAHPAFNLDINADEEWQNYYLYFEKDEYIERHFIIDGILQNTKMNVPLDNHKLVLSNSMFAEDAWIIKNLKSTNVLLCNNYNDFKIGLKFNNFTFFGIWSLVGNPFICLEPWCGINDKADSSEELKDKEGVNVLPPFNEWSRCWEIYLK